MFVYSLKASTIKFFGVICVAMAALIALIVFVPTGDIVATDTTPQQGINYAKIKDNDARREFLRQFGWEVGEKEIESIEVTVPKEFDRVMTEYNEIQRRQGLDLSAYKGKSVSRYTYEVTNYEGYDGEVKANLLIYRNRIIACDISSADPGGFVEPIVKQQFFALHYSGLGQRRPPLRPF